MHQDKLNKVMQEKINSMKELPQGVSFQQLSTWNKIENKLSDRKEKKIWWHYAAAVLLLITSAILLYNSGAVNKSTEMAATKGTTPAIGNKNFNKIPMEFESSESASPLANNLPIMEQITKKNKLTQSTIENPTVIKHKQLQEKPRPKSEVKEDAILPALPDLTAIEPAPILQINRSTIQVKRKFKVVHINDENSDATFKNVALDKTQRKPAFFNFTLRSQNTTEETSTITSSPKNQGGLFKAELN